MGHAMDVWGRRIRMKGGWGFTIFTYDLLPCCLLPIFFCVRKHFVQYEMGDIDFDIWHGVPRA